jgi:protein tyrosine/serine phosphatase
VSPLRIGASAVVVLIAAFLIWEELLEDRLIPKRWGVVVEGSIYRSGQLHPALVKSTLADNRIDVIVNMNRLRLDRADQATEEQAADELGIEQVRFPMGGDGTGDPEQYALAVARVHRAVEDGERVLVHCSAGTQRTGAVIALYRLFVQGWTPDAAMAEMEQYGLDPVDDEILFRFLDNNMTFLGRRLKELGVVATLPDPLPRFRASDR